MNGGAGPSPVPAVREIAVFGGGHGALAMAGDLAVRVGPDVTHPLLVHPVVTAASLAALDELTGGRAVLGVGRGSVLEPLGLRPAPPEAVRRLVEVIEHHLAGGFLWTPTRCGRCASWARSSEGEDDARSSRQSGRSIM